MARFFELRENMIPWIEFNKLSLDKKVGVLYRNGTFIMSIRYYEYKVNLYLLDTYYIEVFINHKQACIEKIILLDTSHSRMRFYSDQIKLPSDLYKPNGPETKKPGI